MPEQQSPTPRPTKHSSGKKLFTNSLVAVSSAAVFAIYAAGYARTNPVAAELANTVPLSPTAPAAVAAPPTATATTAPPTATTAPTTAPSNSPTGRKRERDDDDNHQGRVPPAGAGQAGATGQPVAPGGSGAAAQPRPPTQPQPATQTVAPTPSTAPVPSTAPAASVPAAATTGAYKDGTYSGTGTSRHGNITVAVTVQSGKITSAEITDCGTRYPCSRVAALPGQVLSRQSASVDTVSGATDSTNAYRSAVVAALAQAR